MHYPNRRPKSRRRQRRSPAKRKQSATTFQTGPVEIATLRFGQPVQAWTKGAPKGANLHDYAFASVEKYGAETTKNDILSEFKKFLTPLELKHVTFHGDVELDEFDSNNLSHANAFFNVKITAPKHVIEKIRKMEDEGYSTEVMEVQSAQVIYDQDDRKRYGN